MKPMRWVRRGMAGLGLGTAGGAAALALRHTLLTPQPLASGLPGEGRIDREHGGEVYYTVAGPTEGQPIVLLHDFYPGASSYEYCSLLPRLAQTHRVYAPDWLGFGMSERPPLAYTGEFYAGTLAGFLRDVVAQPATVIASGRAANIAARAASDAPELFERLVLVSPHAAAGLQLDPTLVQALVRLAQRASLGIVPYALVSSRPVLRIGASRRGLGAAAEDALDHEWAAAHQLNAQYAVLAALTGELDLPLQHVLPLLEPPVLLVGGELDQRHPREQMEELAILNPYADLDIIPGAGAAVAQDQPARLATTLTLWLQRELPRHASTSTLRVGSPASTTSATASPRAGRRPSASRASGATATLAAVETTESRDAPRRSAATEREATVNATEPDELPTVKRSAVRKSTSTQQQAVNGPRPKTAANGRAANGTATGQERTTRATPATNGHGAGGAESVKSASRATTRRAANPSRPRTETHPAATTKRQHEVNGETAADEPNATRPAEEKRATGGRDRTRSQTQPRAKRDSSGNERTTGK